MTRWMCVGSVRGCCGVAHRTRDAAERCSAADQRDCASLGGGAYSDRRPVSADTWTYSERCKVPERVRRAMGVQS